MFSRLSLSVKYSIVFLITGLLIAGAMLVSLYYFKQQVLRNEAQAVSSQVVSFRSWIAKSGMVWVDNLSKDFHDFLAKRPDDSGKFYFGKNPALATRELSSVANELALRATFRVTSDEYRHPANAPDSFEQAAIEALKADLNLAFVEGFEEGVYRYVQPIYVEESCLKCHGSPTEAPPEVLERYGAERAFGYKVGDVRGVISVKLPDIAMKNIAHTLLNPITLTLIALAFAVNLLFTQWGLIRRLRRLTEAAEAISQGNLEAELSFTPADRSKDEVDHAANAVNLLRNSLRVAMRHMKRR